MALTRIRAILSLTEFGDSSSAILSCLVSYPVVFLVFSGLLWSFEQIELFHLRLEEIVAGIFERWIEIIRLLSKEPIGSSKQVLRVSPATFHKLLKILVDIFMRAAAFTLLRKESAWDIRAAVFPFGPMKITTRAEKMVMGKKNTFFRVVFTQPFQKV